MVMVSHGRYPASQCGFTIPYQGAAPYQIHHVFDMCRPLPNLTKIIARDAKVDGGFGLVVPLFTNTYQSADLGLNLGQNTITNHYHREEGDSQLNRAYRLVSCIVHQGGPGTQRGTAWRTVLTLRKGHTVRVGVAKKKEKNLTMVA